MLNQQNKIIIFIIILLIASSVSLFFFEGYYKNTTGGNWWAVYFEDPKNNDLNFVIENRGAEADFVWELWLGNKKVREGKESIEKDGRKNIEITQELPVAYKEKTSIKVISNNEKKEIYKNF